MSGPHPRTLISYLALWVAAGRRVKAWAEANDVPLRTAYEWHRSPGFKRRVARYRRRYLERAIGLLTHAVIKSAKVEIRLAGKGESESIQLQAARAVFADLIAVSRFSDFEKRLTDLERRHHDGSDEPVGPA